MISPMGVNRNEFASDNVDIQNCEDELQPYLSLFVKPMTGKRSEFSKHELAVMCKDPLHSPRLIHYLIEFIRTM